MRRALTRSVSLLAGMVLAVAGCAGDGQPTASSSSGPVVRLPSAGEPWDLLYISDSSGWQVAELYGKRAEKALGVQVRVHDWAIGGLSAVQALWEVQESPGTVRDAEIIVVFGNASASGGSGGEEYVCAEPGTDKQAPATWSPADWTAYRGDLDKLYAEIWRLRQGTPTVMRGVDYFVGTLADWRAVGIDKGCTADFEAMSRTIRAAAEANGATMVSLYDALNGPTHQVDLRTKGYIGPDGEHATLKGATVIADTLAAAGFERNTPPARLPIARTPSSRKPVG